MEETPRSKRTPSARENPAAFAVSASWEKRDRAKRNRSPNRDSRPEATSTAAWSRSSPRTEGTPASSSASACPPAPTVASITAAFPDRSSTTSAPRTGVCGLSKHPDGQEAQTDVAGQHCRHQSHQQEALPDLFLERCSLHCFSF